MPETVFISWSGERSKHIAEALREWLSRFFKLGSLDIWLSVADIEPGGWWDNAIFQKLQAAHYGILCLTPENRDRPWILFEAGAISKVVGKSRVCPYLYYVDRSLLKDSPLYLFQSVKADRTGTLSLVEGLNALLGALAYPDEILKIVFEAKWPELDLRLSNTPELPAVQLSERSERDILEEILRSIRGADAHRYLDEFSKPPEDRSIEPFELTTALNTVVRWVFQELNLKFTPGSGVDYEIVIGKETVLIETKMRDLQQTSSYFNDMRHQLETAYDEARRKAGSNVSAIVAIPNDSEVSAELNRQSPYPWLYFCPVTQLKEHLSRRLEQAAAEGL